MQDQLLKTISRIQKLIAKADDAGCTPEEAASFRAKAEELIRQYRIQEEDLLAQDPTSYEPIMHSFFLHAFRSPVGHGYREMAATIAFHTGCLAVSTYQRDGVWMNFVGYESDVRLAEILYASAMIVFQRRVDPKVDPSATAQDNCYTLRSAGMLRREVAVLVFGDNTPALRSKVQRLYEAACKAKGETPQVEGGVNAKDYRVAYADGFNSQLRRDLWRARDAADSAAGPVVLHGRSERVQEAMYRFFPDLRPSDEPVPANDKPIKYKGPTKRDLDRAYRRTSSPAARAGQRAGREAAKEVELDGPARAKRIDS
jgi:Protein of unknown function (DUF2786)